MRHRFIFADSSKCIGCLSCELACAAANAGISFQEAYATAKSLISRNRVVKYEGKTAPLQCMHCEDASCMAVCPHGVIEKMDDFRIYFGLNKVLTNINIIVELRKAKNGSVAIIKKT